jgi:hypothetical protein
MEGKKLRLLGVVAIACLTGLVFASVGRADTVGKSNAAVQISASLANGSNALSLTAAPGETVNASASVTNLLSSWEYTRIYLISSWDKGWSPNMNKLKKIKEGDTWDISGSFRPLLPGTYTLQLISVSAGIIDPLEVDATILVL